MSFKLTSDFIFGLLNEAASGNPEPLMETVDPEVQWRIGSETKDDVAKTGIFVQLYENRASWVEQVFGPLQSKLINGLKLMPLEVEVFGSKAFVEFKGEATQNNGQSYNNYYLWVMLFDEHGHATEIREYLDTSLVKEVFTGN
ncbi:hypothetical protein MMC34_006623 [Xylographa carneopallida]|nr:hypothetical protein [Xylographa carneopallida]